ncbi:hypothetical protein ACWEPL_61555 [Nonomuraea sp. NPDC004186]
MDSQPAKSLRSLLNSELLRRFHAAVGRLLDHQQQTEAKHACLHDADPWAPSVDCPLRQEVAELHAEIATRGDMIVLAAANPIPGFASVKVRVCPVSGVSRSCLSNGWSEPDGLRR